MARIQATTGLVSGIPISQTINELMSIEQEPVTALTTQDTTVQSQQTSLAQLEALLTTIQGDATSLGKANLFTANSATSSDPSALTATVTGTPPLGSFQYTPLQTVQSEQWLSSGVASSSAALGATGSLTFRSGSPVDAGVSLSELNGGAGFTPGSIRITDGSGATATVDLSNCQTIDDVIQAIDQAGTIDVTAAADGNHLVLTDHSDATTPSVKVQEVGGGTTAASLGLAGVTASGGTLTGNSILYLSDQTNLDALNDGAGVDQNNTAADISYTLSNGATGEITLAPLAGTGATQAQRETTLGQVINTIETTINGNSPTPLVQVAINSAGNGLTITDLTGGTQDAFQLTAINGSAALQDLGLGGTAVADPVTGDPTITGTPILGGLKTVLLSDLNGGQGLGTLGNLQLTDQAGNSVTVNLSGDATLQAVIDDINTAAANAATKVGITAAVNAAGDGIQLTDTTGKTQSALIAADTGDGTTTATKLGIAGSSTSGAIQGTDLNLQSIALSTPLADLNGGSGVAQGTFTITNSSGQSATIDLRNSNIQTVGDVIDAINGQVPGVTAQLNSSGDGILLEDTSGGSGALAVAEGNSTTAADLHLLSAATQPTTGGPWVVNGSTATVVNVAATDSLSDLVTKINSANAGVTASILNDGSSTPYRLSLTASQPGLAGQMIVDPSNLGLSLQQTVAPQDALLKLGGSGTLVSSSTNSFSNVLSGATLQVEQATGQPVTIGVTTSDANLSNALQSLVTDYNNFRQQLGTDTNYDTTTNTPSVLTGDPGAIECDAQLADLLSGQFIGSGSIQSLAQVGVTTNQDGTLSFNQSVLDSAFAADPGAVQQFFTTKTQGFSDQVNTLVNQLAGQTNSLLSSEVQGLQNTVTQNQTQITNLNAHLANEENLLYTQFDAMESAIGQLQNELNVINTIYYVPPVGSSESSATSTGSSTLMVGNANLGTTGSSG